MTAAGPAGPRRALGFLALFASLYAVQGVVVAYLFNFNKPYMLALGLRERRRSAASRRCALLPLALEVPRRPALGPLQPLRPRAPAAVHRPRPAGPGGGSPRPGDRSTRTGTPGVFAAMAVLDGRRPGVLRHLLRRTGRRRDAAGGAGRVQGLLWTSRFLAATVFTLGFGAWLGRLGGRRFTPTACSSRRRRSARSRSRWRCGLREPRGPPTPSGSTGRRSGVMVRPWSLALLAFGGLYGVAGMGVESNLSLLLWPARAGPGGDVGALGACRNLGRAAGAVALPAGRRAGCPDGR